MNGLLSQVLKELYNVSGDMFDKVYTSSSSRSLTRPVQQQWCSWWSSSGSPSPHIISGEAELLKATVPFALVGVCYISEEHARLSGPPHHRDTLGEGTIFSFMCMCALSLLCALNFFFLLLLLMFLFLFLIMFCCSCSCFSCSSLCLYCCCWWYCWWFCRCCCCSCSFFYFFFSSSFFFTSSSFFFFFFFFFLFSSSFFFFFFFFFFLFSSSSSSSSSFFFFVFFSLVEFPVYTRGMM